VPTHRQLVGRTTMGALFMVMASACSAFGPDLHISIDNAGPKEVTVTFDSSGPRTIGGPNVMVLARNTGMEWSEPLPSTWEVQVDGIHVVGSDDRTGALPPPGQRQDVLIEIEVAKDGTVRLLDAP
jgi:hypothetical protein